MDILKKLVVDLTSHVISADLKLAQKVSLALIVESTVHGIRKKSEIPSRFLTVLKRRSCDLPRFLKRAGEGFVSRFFGF